MDTSMGGRPKTIQEAKLFSFFISKAALDRLQERCERGQVASVIRRLIEEFLAREQGAGAVEHP